MEFELTEDEIDKICLDNRLNLVPIEIIARNIAHEAQKELFKHFKKRATFMEWEWEDSKGIWNIVFDDNEMQSLVKHFEVGGE